MGEDEGEDMLSDDDEHPPDPMTSMPPKEERGEDEGSWEKTFST